jgi:aryl-alcohol dehydrogenase-like predicted oxidoreductase
MRYPLSDSSNDIAFDYTADGVRRSIEDSLQRLGVDSLDVAFVHNISRDFAYFPDGGDHNGIAKIGRLWGTRHVNAA